MSTRKNTPYSLSRSSRFLFLLLAMLILAGCGGSAQPSELTRIRLPMGYIADPQFAPFYVAVQKGYFAAEGLAIEFDYGFETDGIALVGAGELQFAVVSGEQVILARAQELPVVYLFEWFQRFPIAIMSKAETGIVEPADLYGRTVGLPGFFGASYIGYLGFLAANDLQFEAIDNQDIGFTQIESLLTDQVDAVVGYTNNEPVQLAAQGAALNQFNVADAVDLVANGIITNEETIADNPELVAGFVRAVHRGLADTLADPDEAFAISKQFVEGLEDDRRAVLTASLPLWEAKRLGETEAASWENTARVLLDAGLLDAPLTDLENAYTNEFLPAESENE